MLRAHIFVKGLVQGVGFRWFVEREAIKLGLYGTVENLDNGDVEVWAEGPRSDIERLIKTMWRGNGTSHMEGCKVDWVDATGEFASFRMKSSHWR